MKTLTLGASQKAFTIIELIAVFALLTLLCCLATTGMAKAKTRAPGVGCLSNIRQLMAGWAMYSEENNGTLMPNAPLSVPMGQGWCAGFENWSFSDANTNPVYYLGSLMGPYVSSNITVYRCPGDVVPSQNGPRLRSYSMNGQMGGSFPYGAPYRSYTKEADLTCPAPKDAFIFCDEHPLSLNDGFLQVNFSTPQYVDLPASYLEGGCGFSFADGHGEIHKWKGQFIQVPVFYGQTYVGPVSSSGTDPDWKWLRDHSACLP